MVALILVQFSAVCLLLFSFLLLILFAIHQTAESALHVFVLTSDPDPRHVSPSQNIKEEMQEICWSGCFLHLDTKTLKWLFLV